jgi:dethiobiotin synthetase
VTGILVTGTDTGVGKTAIAAGLLALLRGEGVRAAPFKPVESGHEGGAEDWPPDASCLLAASGLALRRDEVVPYVLREPLAPMVGARRDGVRIDLGLLDRAYAGLERRHDLVVVEGAGGLAVPITPEADVAGLAQRWRLPVLVVARPGLGTINHTALTVAYARQWGLEVLGVVVNRYPREPGVAEETNPKAIEQATGVPVLGLVPELEGVDTDAGQWQPLAHALHGKVDLRPVHALLQGGGAGRRGDASERL